MTTYTVQISQVGMQGPKGANWRSDWLVDTDFAVNDVVSSGGSVYICTAVHTSSAADEPHTGANAATYWDLFVDSGDSAYQAWLELGNTGTEQDFLDDISAGAITATAANVTAAEAAETAAAASETAAAASASAAAASETAAAGSASAAATSATNAGTSETNAAASETAAAASASAASTSETNAAASETAAAGSATAAASSASAASTSETNAAASASAASTSETNAAASETAAAASASAASTSETNAAASASAASTSETNAAASETNAAASASAASTSETNAAASETAAAASASAAASSATSAAESANAASLASNAPKWVSGETFVQGDLRWSPIDFQTYRAITNHSGETTDPSLDTTNWVEAIAAGEGAMLKVQYDPQSIAADAFARANHTGTQAISTVAGLQTALDSKASSDDAVALAIIFGS